MKLKLLSALCVLALNTAAGAETITASYQDWWWDPAQSGMGVNIGQNDDTLVVAWYHFAEDGRGTYLMLSGELNGNRLSGDLYRTSGPQPGPGYDPAKVLRTRVGTASLQFSSSGQATLNYSFDGSAGQMSLQRFAFSQPAVPQGAMFGSLYVFNKECTDSGNIVGTDGNSSYQYRVDVDPEDTQIFQFPAESAVALSHPSSGKYVLGPVRFTLSTPHEFLRDAKNVGGAMDRTNFECNYQFALYDSDQGLTGGVTGTTAQCSLTMTGAQLKSVQGTYTGELKVRDITWSDTAIVAEYTLQSKYQTAVCNETGKIIFDKAISALQ